LGEKVPTLLSFEDLEVWKTARDFVHEVYRMTRVGPLSKDYLNESLFDHLHKKSGQINRQLAGFISYLRKSKMKGAKYK
jgi:hypothetical protein